MDESHLPKSKHLIFFAWIICIIATLNYSYDFFIRAAPGVMSEELIDAFKINSASIGWLSSAYFIAYTTMQIPAGVIIDKYNRKYVIAIATMLCVIGNFLFSATNYYEVAFLGRILMGVGSAFGFVGAAKMAGMWLPQRFFSTFIGIATIVGILGGLVTDTVLASLVNSLGWREGNTVFTYIGVGLLIFVLIFIKDNHKHVEKFRHFNEANFAETIQKVLKIFKNYKFWAASLIGASIFIPINVLGSLWGVTFIQHKLEITQTQASNLNATLFIGAAIGYAIFGIIAAFTTRLRLMLILSLIFSVTIIFLLLFVDLNKTYFICLYTLLGVMAGPQAVTFTIAKVISPPGTSGSSTAGVNMINNLFAVILLPVIGYVLTYVTTHLDDGYNNIIDFQYALSIVIIIFLICIPLCFLLPKNVDI
ncbi:MFS transporter [Candidatus Francisella endociliophora]|uniref:Lysosomal dipeptide transporter MFSD1 n=1 Tax=Candidatus Francisella endociliophora TaxID=653937 RepID=A0A097EPF0_9GAMM|nr:MFS transporter [Francisella sp. FSC1006]AIT09444.1 MFS transporter [Francisella sp. FSC1006]